MPFTAKPHVCSHRYRWLTSAVIFGYQSFLPLLYHAGVFKEACEGNTEPGDDGQSSWSWTPTCPEQERRLDLLFMMSMMAFWCSMPVAGVMLHSWGPRALQTFAFAMLGVVATCLLMLGGASVWALSPALGFMASFGTVAQLPVLLHASSRVETWAAHLAGWREASSAVFLSMAAATYWGAVPLRFAVGVYVAAAGVVILGSLFTLPARSPTPSEDKQHHGQSWPQHLAEPFLGSTPAGPVLSTEPVQRRRQEPLCATFSSHVLPSRAFWGAAAIMFVLSLRDILYAATVNQQARWLVRHAGAAGKDVDLFMLVYNIALPALGWLSMFGVECWLRSCAGNHNRAFGGLLALALVQCALNCIPELHCQYAAAALFFVLRSGKWAVFLVFISTSFPPDAIGVSVAVVFAALAPVGVAAFFVDTLAGDTLGGDFLAVNVALAALLLTCMLVPLYLDLHPLLTNPASPVVVQQSGAQSQYTAPAVVPGPASSTVPADVRGDSTGTAPTVAVPIPRRVPAPAGNHRPGAPISASLRSVGCAGSSAFSAASSDSMRGRARTAPLETHAALQSLRQISVQGDSAV